MTGAPDEGGGMTYSASIVIPANNEARVIGRLLDNLRGDNLRGLRGDSSPGEDDAAEFDVVVVCNGCNDDTAEIARTRGAKVLEISQSSKTAALNAGDKATTVFPRIYLDADIAVSLPALRAVIGSLIGGAVAAAPTPIVDTTGCGWISRAYFEIWSRLGYATVGALGSGLYGVSAQGRARFGEFPEIIADDGYVYCAFDTDERINPVGATFTIQAPRTAAALLRRRVRIVAGNIELKALLGRAITPPAPTWKQILRAQPRLIPAGAVYVVVNCCARLAARRRARLGTRGAWHRDPTTRQSI